MNFLKLAEVAAEILGGPIASNAAQLVTALGKMRSDLSALPFDSDGKPLTLEAASAHLTAARAASQAQDAALKAQAQQALDDDARQG